MGEELGLGWASGDGGKHHQDGPGTLLLRNHVRQFVVSSSIFEVIKAASLRLLSRGRVSAFRDS